MKYRFCICIKMYIGSKRRYSYYSFIVECHNSVSKNCEEFILLYFLFHPFNPFTYIYLYPIMITLKTLCRVLSDKGDSARGMGYFGWQHTYYTWTLYILTKHWRHMSANMLCLYAAQTRSQTEQKNRSCHSFCQTMGQPQTATTIFKLNKWGKFFGKVS